MTNDELLARVEGLTGPDREIDFALYAMVSPAVAEHRAHGATDYVDLPPGFGQDALSMAMDPRPRYTASIDAALALVERVLPGWVLELTYSAPISNAGLHQYDDGAGTAPLYVGVGRMPSIAILSAFLRARATSGDGR